MYELLKKVTPKINTFHYGSLGLSCFCDREKLTSIELKGSTWESTKVEYRQKDDGICPRYVLFPRLHPRIFHPETLRLRFHETVNRKFYLIWKLNRNYLKQTTTTITLRSVQS